MAESKRQCSLQIVVDSVDLNREGPGDCIASDLRLSVSLSSFPIVHVAPRKVHIPEGDQVTVSDHEPFRSVAFGGAGKSCTFLSNRSFLEVGQVVFLLVRRIDAFDDYLILTMTSPTSFRDLSLSLPSSSEDYDPPFVSRRFEFLDNMGSCEVRLRLLQASRKIPRTLKTAQLLTIQHQPESPGKSTPRKVQTLEKSLPIVRVNNQSGIISSPKYGKMRTRNPLLKLLN